MTTQPIEARLRYVAMAFSSKGRSGSPL